MKLLALILALASLYFGFEYDYKYTTISEIDGHKEISNQNLRGLYSCDKYSHVDLERNIYQGKNIGFLKCSFDTYVGNEKTERK